MEDPGIYIDRSLREDEGEIAVDDITAYQEGGYEFVGLFRTSPRIPPQELPNTPQDEPLDLEELPVEPERASGWVQGRRLGVIAACAHVGMFSCSQYTNGGANAQLPSGCTCIFRREVQTMALIPEEDVTTFDTANPPANTTLSLNTTLLEANTTLNTTATNATLSVTAGASTPVFAEFSWDRRCARVGALWVIIVERNTTKT